MNNDYNAEEVAAILKDRGDSSITKRTVNYYAFEKEMFDLPRHGKKCFSDIEVEKISAIRMLQNHTNFTLQQIKAIINTKPIEEIKTMCVSKLLPEDWSIVDVDHEVRLLVSNKINQDKLRKIIANIKNPF